MATASSTGNLYFTGYVNGQLFSGSGTGAFLMRMSGRLDNQLTEWSLSSGQNDNDIGVGIESDGLLLDLLSNDQSGENTFTRLRRFAEPNFAVVRCPHPLPPPRLSPLYALSYVLF